MVPAACPGGAVAPSAILQGHLVAASLAAARGASAGIAAGGAGGGRVPALVPPPASSAGDRRAAGYGCVGTGAASKPLQQLSCQKKGN